jgi:hypothetical protein
MATTGNLDVDTSGLLANFLNPARSHSPSGRRAILLVVVVAAVAVVATSM